MYRCSLLFTGASGFLGGNIRPLLSEKYNVVTLGLTNEDDFNANLAEEIPVFNDRYDVVFHAAGKAHSVPKTEEEKRVFYDVNYKGTKNLCLALERVGVPQSFIFVSTVAVYGVEDGEGYTENTPLNGSTPYAKSKIMAEEYLSEWCAKHNVILGIIRPSLIAGPNAPGNLGAMVNGIRSGKYLSIAGGKARKSVLMVQDIANLIPLIAEKGGIYNVCDDEQPTFQELEELIAAQLGIRKPLTIPYWMAKGMAMVGDCLGSKFPINSMRLDKITKSLTFSNEKAKKELGWKPILVLENYKIW